MGSQAEVQHLKETYSSAVMLPSVTEGLVALGVLSAYADIEFDMSPDMPRRDINEMSLRKHMVSFQSMVLPILAYPSVGGGPPSFLSADYYDSCRGNRPWLHIIAVLRVLYERDYPQVATALDHVAVIIAHEAEWKRKVRYHCTPESIDEIFDVTDRYLTKPAKVVPYRAYMPK